MASEEIVVKIIEMTSTMLVYMLPVIAILAGINFIVTWLMSITMGLGKRTFRG